MVNRHGYVKTKSRTDHITVIKSTFLIQIISQMNQIIADQNKSSECHFGCGCLIPRAKTLNFTYKVINTIFHSTLNYRHSQGERIYSNP